MSLGVGAWLGHYAVTAKLGEGGMGEVWRATDTQLNRDVAPKILPEAFAADPDRLARVHARDAGSRQPEPSRHRPPRGEERSHYRKKTATITASRR